MSSRGRGLGIVIRIVIISLGNCSSAMMNVAHDCRESANLFSCQCVQPFVERDVGSNRRPAGTVTTPPVLQNLESFYWNSILSPHGLCTARPMVISPRSDRVLSVLNDCMHEPEIFQHEFPLTKAYQEHPQPTHRFA
jgi:hypothetical protein